MGRFGLDFECWILGIGLWGSVAIEIKGAAHRLAFRGELHPHRKTNSSRRW